MAKSPRKAAIELIMNMDKTEAYSNILLNKLRFSDSFSEVDMRFISEIVHGVIKYKLTLETVIAKHSSVKLKKISPFVLAVLKAGIYQILFMNRVPDSAAVNESVKIVKKSSVYKLSGYVNAVLRAVTPADLDEMKENTSETVSAKYSYPLWLTKRWIAQFGMKKAIQLMKALNEKSPLYIRCNTLINTPRELLEILKSEEISAQEIKVSGFSEFKDCIRLDSNIVLSKLSSFAEGRFYIQDPAAMLAAYLLDPRSGDCIYDLCAAPGGKSTYIAQLMQNKGIVKACDIYEQKLETISENCQRLKIDIIQPCLMDASVYHPEMAISADRILCDVPCSGLGIIRKKPEIKYSKTEADIKELAKLSAKILENAYRYLKPGGTLVYSTCTIDREENEDVVRAFIAAHTDMKPIAFGDDGCYKDGILMLYPDEAITDGFFISKMQKGGEQK